ncbi:MAG TPA: hypothetical protein VF292_03415 [Rhodanobacteraceae bacterium]
MTYARVLAERRAAIVRCRAERETLRVAVADAVGTYQAHPAASLATAAGAGFVLARLRISGGAVRAAVRVASGPAWGLVRQYLAI